MTYMPTEPELRDDKQDKARRTSPVANCQPARRGCRVHPGAAGGRWRVEPVDPSG